ncbi:hypothetical protein VC290_21250 [Xanthomonas campestris]|uniref:hypothetical protein n=1 Tax=Xanthomonas campestris TaxID=339 RepID=UPI002B239DDE|nr:hypothetical protein [Xanthomonas campestris]MEA9482800.1 hypothetical protein [Xanthomonas campestris]
MANFSVAARTLIHLGAELITSDEVALNELIKNAFDAESKRVRIEFRIGLPQAELDQLLDQARSHPSGDEDLSTFVDNVVKRLSADREVTPQHVVTPIDSLQAAASWPEVVALLERIKEPLNNAPQIRDTTRLMLRSDPCN